MEKWWTRFFIGIPLLTSCRVMDLDGNFFSDVSRAWAIKNAEGLLSSRKSFDLFLRVAEFPLTSMYEERRGTVSRGTVSWVLLVARQLTLDYTPKIALACVLKDLGNINNFQNDSSHGGDILPGGVVVKVECIEDVKPVNTLRALQAVVKKFPFIKLMQFGQRIV